MRYRLSAAQIFYFAVHSGAEVDLVLQYPKQEPIFIEIKSTKSIQTQHKKNLELVQVDFPKSKFYIVSQDVINRKEGNIQCEHWKDFIENLV